MKILLTALILLSIVYTATANVGIGYSEGYFRHKIKKSELVFIGHLTEVTTAYTHNGKEITEEEAAVINDEYLSSESQEVIEKHRAPIIHYKASLKLDRVLKGQSSAPKSIELRWEDHYGSMCKHRVTSVLNKKGVYWLPGDKDDDVPYVPIEALHNERIIGALKEQSADHSANASDPDSTQRE